MSKVAVVMLAGNMQNTCFWPSYYNCDASQHHDLIVVHRDSLGLPTDMKNNHGEVILLNKIVNGVDVPHRAFGGYRFAYQTFKDKYDYFIFISDDVILKRDNWLKDIISTLEQHEKLGFGASQIFNGGKAYPHESHIRAPFWFAKTKALNDTVWEFDSDHDGEMKIGDQLTNTGYFGVQVGNKINLGYDALEKDHITQLLDYKYSGDLSNIGIDDFIVSPYAHIGRQNVYIDLQPFDGLIYAPSLEIAKASIELIDKGHNIYTLK